MVNFEYTDSSTVDCSIKPDLSKLRGKSVLVTGGSSGLGAAYVKAFLDAGAFVTNADVQPSKDQDGSQSYQYAKCDVTSWDDQLSVFKLAIANSPGKSLDVVVANAGIAGSDPVHQLEDNDEPTRPDLNILNIDLIGVVYTAKLAMHYFNKQDAARDKSLILKSSLAGYIDLPGATQYQVSKYGVRGLMCNLRRANRMRVNLIAPWFIHTAIMSDETFQGIDATLKKFGASWADSDDAVKACLRCAVDEKVNGRAFAVLPRDMEENGYKDLAYDDYEGRPDIKRLLDIATGSSHRIDVPAEQQ